MTFLTLTIAAGLLIKAIISSEIYESKIAIAGTFAWVVFAIVR